MKKTKIVITIAFALILTIAMFSGCLRGHGDEFPVVTIKPDVSHIYRNVQLRGAVGYLFCKAKNHTFVYDTESHENWEDYAFTLSAGPEPPDAHYFYYILGFSELQEDITYYVRAVVYCYNFKFPYKVYEEGYYQGRDQTFIIET
jgi:hypothetical protein